MGLQHENFLGQWLIERRIEDRLAKAEARFDGCAEITKAVDGWQFAEAGQLSVPGSAPMQAERRYIWHPVEGGFEICFEDGRPFHQLVFGLNAEAAHWCDPDQYDVRYDFQNWPEWEAVWTVNGPRKDYRMTSRFRCK